MSAPISYAALLREMADGGAHHLTPAEAASVQPLMGTHAAKRRKRLRTLASLLDRITPAMIEAGECPSSVLAALAGDVA